MSTPELISSHDNALLVRLRKLARDGAAYRKLGVLWLEGEHLCEALRASGRPAALAVLTQSAWAVDARLRALAAWAAKTVVVPDAQFKLLSTLESAPPIGFVLDASPSAALDPNAASIVFDRVQDPGNVGSMLRTAAAMGVRQVLAIKGTAALWSPKVLRAGMGAHFALALHEGLDENALAALRVPLLATSSHAGQSLREATLPRPSAWVFGHEGQGVSATLLARCALQLRIAQPGGEESLNVAAAAAICLYEAASRTEQ